MFKWADLKRWAPLLCLALASTSAGAQAEAKKTYPGIGRPATTAEIAAWDIDVRPDFKSLPAGSGTVQKGMEIWDAQCAGCHGTFGESNEVFTPIVGGTTEKDQLRGRVASLIDQKTPQRTTLMKVATVSTLWDYIYRAMPWYAPRSLSVDDTYSVLSYVLYLGEIIPENFVLSQQTMAQVQARMPNRNGMTQQHGLGKVDGQADVKAVACMQACRPFVQIGSVLPEHARNAHNNLALQNRPYGPFLGIDTTLPRQK